VLPHILLIVKSKKDLAPGNLIKVFLIEEDIIFCVVKEIFSSGTFFNFKVICVADAKQNKLTGATIHIHPFEPCKIINLSK